MDTNLASSIERAVLNCGACAAGIVAADSVDPSDSRLYDNWLALGRHARMDYMERNSDLRRDPRVLMPGCRTVIAAAFNVRTATHCRLIADYAQGIDYHYVLKDRLARAARQIADEHGGEWRVVVDSAPMRERYWAQRAGLGSTGRNGMLFVPGFGAAVVLGFILWTGCVATPSVAPADLPAALPDACLHCDLCLKACPGQALAGDGSVDARNCHSYLSIEHRGDFPDPQPRLRKVYGCDICRRVCPMDKGPVTDIPEFQPLPEITGLSLDEMQRMGPGAFRRLTASSPLSRLRVQGLRRNAALIERNS